jgi:hypothetical protein
MINGDEEIKMIQIFWHLKSVKLIIQVFKNFNLHWELIIFES